MVNLLAVFDRFPTLRAIAFEAVPPPREPDVTSAPVRVPPRP
ncbi:hypothetical protein OG320_05390 [Microbispora sp. NBC_01189]|nr:hypothetical protein OG320_05390 [Microbispora sp. NBC_01189]